ncbi:MAG: PAS domain-containing protein [Desulfobacterales bacterium]|nr:PAS domain-containing protein [Desulfobacterales bacterium]
MAKKPTYEELEQRVKSLEKEAVKYKQIKQELAKTTELMEYMLDVSPAILYRCKPRDPYPATYISNNIKQQLGYEPEDFTDDPQFWVNHIHPDDAELILSRLQSLFKKGYHSHE